MTSQINTLVSNPDLLPSLMEGNPDLKNKCPQSIEILKTMCAGPGNPNASGDRNRSSQPGQNFSNPGQVDKTQITTMLKELTALFPVGPGLQNLNPSLVPETGAVSNPLVSSPGNIDFEEVYKSQLEALNDMGFTDHQLNLQVLKECNGDIVAAIDRLDNLNQ